MTIHDALESALQSVLAARLDLPAASAAATAGAAAASAGAGGDGAAARRALDHALASLRAAQAALARTPPPDVRPARAFPRFTAARARGADAAASGPGDPAPEAAPAPLDLLGRVGATVLDRGGVPAGRVAGVIVRRADGEPHALLVRVGAGAYRCLPLAGLRPGPGRGVRTPLAAAAILASAAVAPDGALTLAELQRVDESYASGALSPPFRSPDRRRVTALLHRTPAGAVGWQPAAR